MSVINAFGKPVGWTVERSKPLVHRFNGWAIPMLFRAASDKADVLVEYDEGRLLIRSQDFSVDLADAPEVEYQRGRAELVSGLLGVFVGIIVMASIPTDHLAETFGTGGVVVGGVLLVGAAVFALAAFEVMQNDLSVELQPEVDTHA